MACTAEEFVKAWQTSESPAEVAQKIGLTTGSCTSRAAFYRKKGIPLKKLYGTNRKLLDVAALTKLAKSLNGKG